MCSCEYENDRYACNLHHNKERRDGNNLTAFYSRIRTCSNPGRFSPADLMVRTCL